VNDGDTIALESIETLRRDPARNNVPFAGFGAGRFRADRGEYGYFSYG